MALNNLDSTAAPDRNVQARTNPVFLTAKTAISLMRDAGIEDAARIASILGIQGTESLVDMDDITALGNALVVESKYRTMCRLIEDTGIKTSVDLPCGYTPKALHVTEKGLSFVGLDLPIVVTEVEPIMRHLARHPERMQFHGVDATNLASLEEALRDVKDPVCISTEGMMMYFTQSEAEAVIRNIHSLLAKHGGCWITPDPEVGMQFLFTFQSVWGEAGIHSLMATRDAAAGQSDIFDFGNDFIMNPQDVPGTRAKFEALLRRCGLKAERIGLGDHMPELTAYQRLTPDQVSAFKAAMHNVNYWRITVADGRADNQDGQTPTHKRPFYMGCDVQEGTFHATVEGRLDTISSPELLKEWERVSAIEKIAGVQIDCSKLQYVSSAGLRVLMIMQKALPGSQVKLIGVNSDIQEILDTTGFSAIFEVRP